MGAIMIGSGKILSASFTTVDILQSLPILSRWNRSEGISLWSVATTANGSYQLQIYMSDGNELIASALGVGGTYATLFAGGELLVLKVDGGAEQTITFAVGDQSLVQVIAKINATLVGALAKDTGGELEIETLGRGDNTSIEIVSGTALLTL